MNLPNFKCQHHAVITMVRTCFLLLSLSLISTLAMAQKVAEPVDHQAPKATEDVSASEAEEQVEVDAQTHLINSLLSLSETVTARQKRLADLGKEMSRSNKDIDKTALQTEIDTLALEITQVEQEMDLVVLGLQARQYSKDNGEKEPVNIRAEITSVFEPIVMSIERATEPARRMEELRQLADQAEKRIIIAQNTLDSINGFRDAEVKYPKDIKERLDKHYELWQNRLQEARNIDIALSEQLAATRRARGNSLKQFSEDFGGFILNRGASLLMAMVLGFGFIILCQMIRSSAAYWYRRTHNDVLSASMRIFSMLISIIGIIGGFVIAVTIFNIRQDWLMLAMSLLLALALSWTFVRSLPALGEQTRLLMNLGAVREGERTLVNGLPYRIERLSMYTKLVNPALSGGELVYPVRELIGMHSRPVTDGEAWFPTQIGDWIVRGDKHYQVTKQTPEHVILRRPGGAEDFVPSQEFMDTLFEVISDGYRAVYEFGLDYKHLDIARTEIPGHINQCVQDHIGDVLGGEALLSVDTRFVGLGDSALMFTVLADVGAGLGHEWKKMQKHLNHAVVEACLDQKWAIPFPQLVVHKGK
jgi:hypothetical protein